MNDDGYAVVVCSCSGGPYLGARKAGTPCRCEGCGFIMRDQLVASHADHEAQIRDLLEEREELLTEIRRLRMGNHPAGRALRVSVPEGVTDFVALAEALEVRDAEHEGGA